MNDEIDAKRYRALKSFALPMYNLKYATGETASLYKEGVMHVDAGSWEALDRLLDEHLPQNYSETEKP